MAKIAFWIEKKLAAGFLRLLNATLRYQISNQQSSDKIRCVYAFWHRNLLIMTLQRINSGAGVLVSQSKDGELIAGPLSELGYLPIRGSSTRGGARAMLEMLKAAKDISLAITPDGPKGPSETIKPGLFELALRAGIPIVAVAAHAEREWIFNSWDYFRFPKPFSRIYIVYSDPIPVPSKESFAEAEQAIRAFMAASEASFRAGTK